MNEDIENIQNAHDALKRIHNAANDANEKLLIINEELKRENAFLKAQLSNLEKNLEIQKAVVVNSLSSSQEKHERDYQEILEIKNENKELKIEVKQLKEEISILNSK